MFCFRKLFVDDLQKKLTKKINKIMFETKLFKAFVNFNDIFDSNNKTDSLGKKLLFNNS